MKKLVLAILFVTQLSYSQVGIGTTTVDSSALLEIMATDKGILIPRMTETQRTNINAPATGLLVYQNDGSQGFWYYNGTAWQQFSSTGWSTTGDPGTDATSNFAGTTDAGELSIVAGNTELARIDNSQNVGIGTSNPQALVHLSGTGPVFRLVDGNQATGKVLTSDANGNAYWDDLPSPSGSSTDNDWDFVSGSTINDPIRRDGSVLLGRTGATTNLLEVSDGSTSGNTMSIGDEFIMDGVNELIFSNSIEYDANFGNPTSNDLGFPGNEWNTIYLQNGTVQTSDARRKTNIKDLSYGVADVMKLRAVSYYWKEEKYNGIQVPDQQKEKKLGFIAQETLKVIPEVVKTHAYVQESEAQDSPLILKETAYMGMSYEELLPLLVKAKNEQNVRIKQLVQENKQLLQELLNRKK